MSNRSKTTVATRLAQGFGGVTFLGLLIAGVAVFVMQDVSSKLDSLAKDRMVKVEKFSEFKGNLSLIAALGRDILLSQDPAFEASAQATIAKTRERNTELLGELDKLIQLPEGRRLLQVINDNRPGYNQLIQQAIDADKSGELEQAKQIMLGQAREKRQAIFDAVDESIRMQQKLAYGYAEEATQETRSTVIGMSVLGALMALIGVGVTWGIGRNLRHALGAEPDELAAVAQKVADGDLHPIDGGVRAPRGSVLAALSDMQVRLAGIVSQVRTSSESIATGSSQIAMGNADLSQRTEEQASNLQQTAASMEEISGTVRGNAETAMQASQLAGQAASTASRGGEVMGHLVGTMKEISQASGKISEIIGVIDGIAFQTNILALNAAV
ncbi:MAG: MCP four helix bundle domain-containing protein, partial [Burkholderiales bacterium]|nr:MCP four helix bundle domain-containing protein [Burkholderiales bacterium]